MPNRGCMNEVVACIREITGHFINLQTEVQIPMACYSTVATFDIVIS